MASLVAAAVTVNSQWEEGDRFGKRIRVRRRLSLALTGQGGATNLIPATVLGLAAGQLHWAALGSFTDGGAQIRACWLFTDGTNLYCGDPTNATDATRGIPGDLTGTLVVEVMGLPI